jgi:AcrR family transcriptional regulator
MAPTAPSAQRDGERPASQRRGLESRERIVTAALDLVAEHGPRSREVSVGGIAAGAGVSTGALYHHFPDLESIMTAVAERYMGEMMSAVDAATAGLDSSGPLGNRDIVAYIDARITGYVQFFAARPGLREFWFDDRASDGVIEVHRRYRELISAALQEEFARFTGVTVDPVTFQISTVASGSLYELAFRRDPKGDAVVVAAIRKYLRHYLQDQLDAARSDPG